MLVHAVGEVTHHDQFNSTVTFTLPPINIRNAKISIRHIMLYSRQGKLPANYYMFCSNLVDKSSANPLQEMIAFGTDDNKSSIILHDPPTPFVYISQRASLNEAVFRLHSLASHQNAEINSIKVTFQIENGGF